MPIRNDGISFQGWFSRNPGLIATFSVLAGAWLFVSILFWDVDYGKYILGAGIFTVFLFLILYNLRAGWALMAFCIPLSVSIPLIGDTHRLSFPGELMAIIVLLLTGTVWLLNNVKHREIFNHPLTIVVLLWLAVQWFSVAFTTTMTVVSLKAVVIQTLYVCVFYLAVAWINKVSADFYRLPLLMSIFGTSIICMVELYQYWNAGFHQGFLPWKAIPFFNDHTHLGTLTAMLLPFTLLFTLRGNTFNIPGPVRVLCALCFLLLFTGMIFSLSRGAWLGGLAGIAGIAMLWAGFRFGHYILLIITVGLALVWQFEFAEKVFMETPRLAEVVRGEEEVRTPVGATGGQGSNVSNTERMNRWFAAYNMFRDKPWTGFGPGTYQFQYFAYQEEKYMTDISVLLPGPHETGRGGTVHSEYLLALAEIGLPGFLLFMSFWLMLYYYIIQMFRNGAPPERMLAMGLFFSITVYVVHGLLNNFMGHVETGFILWFFAAMTQRDYNFDHRVSGVDL